MGRVRPSTRPRRSLTTTHLLTIIVVVPHRTRFTIVRTAASLAQSLGLAAAPGNAECTSGATGWPWSPELPPERSRP